ncbi:probable E3 ubiquitin-protein ligase RHY1A [Hordeum vulgare subsp. vulgare]|uniref:probable E3 ubiquitin-protein ligase RHY1A n=1 Tax=Hordeum vulgare subsp. vulgare TaxID=112509 RepID=UPI001D1A39B1|nr:probable E3 ubiquitin-protein ligase RHY1A [Hordeum vulgare subsp. vulgare]
MPIAAKLFYFQRRRPPPPPPLPEPAGPRGLDSPAARRRVHPIRAAHHGPGYEVVRASQIERGASSGSITEPTKNVLFNTGQSINASNDRLPDAVRQAKERLHQRLRSVDLFPERRQAAPAVGTIWAGPYLPSECDICSSEDGRLADRTFSFNSNASLSGHKVKHITAETFSYTVVVAPHDLRAVSKLGQEALQGTIGGDNEAESSMDCSICLEGCHGASNRLIQLRCKHIFHWACLEQWLQSRADCPYCRAGVVLPRKE